MKKNKNGNIKEIECPIVSAWEKVLVKPLESDEWSSYAPSLFMDYNDAEIWKDSTFKPNLTLSCKHTIVKKVLLFSSHYYVCEDCGEEV